LKPLRFVTLVTVILAPLILIGLGFVYYVSQSRYASTENAYVKANKITVSAEISGRVISVFVDENDQVKLGQPLFQLDKEPYLIKLEKAEAENFYQVQRSYLHLVYFDVQDRLKSNSIFFYLQQLLPNDYSY